MLGNLGSDYKDTEQAAFDKAAEYKKKSGSTIPAGDTATESSQNPKNKAKSGVKLLRYPFSKLEKSDDYMRIEIFDFEPLGLGQAGGGPGGDASKNLRLRTTDEVFEGGNKIPLTTIILPIPENIADSNAASWEAGGLNAGAAALGNVTASIVGGQGAKEGDIGKSLQEGGGSIMSIINSVRNSNNATLQRAVTGYTAGLVANAVLGSNVNAFVGRSTGLALNPNQQLLFNSTVGRSFSFGWDIVPRNKDESNMVKDIIRTLKINMAPTRDTAESINGVFLKSPAVFRITYMSGSEPHPFLNRFKTMALTAMSVNYTGSNTYATYDDATPVHMQLALGFAELTAIYSGDYAIGQGKGGVGY